MIVIPDKGQDRQRAGTWGGLTRSHTHIHLIPMSFLVRQFFGPRWPGILRRSDLRGLTRQVESAMRDNLGMAGASIDFAELEGHSVLVMAASRSLETSAKQIGKVPREALLQGLGQALMALAVPYSGIVSIVERAVDSGRFERIAFQKLYDRCIPFEGRIDGIVSLARGRDYFDQPLTAAPLLTLEACNERMKDCLVALESMLDPQLEKRMAAALQEHRSGKTVPLASLN